MRMPPLPPPFTQLTGDRAVKRAVGNRSTQVADPIQIDDYDPAWPALYADHEARIRTALGPLALAVEHVGSTAVPGLAAKNRIDIDLIVAGPADEDAYTPALEAVGYFLRSRDEDWYQHRGLWTEGHGVNLHVFGPDCDEHLRHLIFRDWLRTHPDDLKLYVADKHRSAAEHPLDMARYVDQKATVIVEILRRAGLS